MPEWRAPSSALAGRLEDSRRWFQSEGREGAPLVAHHEDLSGIDLAEQVLAEAQLQGANLRGVRLDSAILLRAALDGADLTGAFLYQADLSKVSATEVGLDDIEAPRARLSRASLTRATAVRANLAGAYAPGLQALRTNLSGAILHAADLSNASLLGSVLHDVDLSEARVEGLVVDQGAMGYASGVERATGEWVELPARGRTQNQSRISDPGSEWELEVGRALRAIPAVRDVQSGLRGVDFVVELNDGSLIAVEATTVRSRPKLVEKAAHADVLVIPGNHDARSEPLESKVVSLDELEPWITQHADDSRLGGVALLQRQADRLRPYLDFMDRLDSDRSVLSRVVVYLDTRDDAMLTSKDRPIVARLPAHLDGSMLGNAMRWAAPRRSELRHILDIADGARSGAGTDTAAATDAAKRAVELERELAAAARSGT